MGNIKESNDIPLIGKTIRDNDNNSTALIIPKEFAKELDIENPKVLMSLTDDISGNRYLTVSKYYHEIVID